MKKYWGYSGRVTSPTIREFQQEFVINFLVIIARVHHAFGVEKICCISYVRMSHTTVIIPLGVKFFSFCPSHSFCAGAAPGYAPCPFSQKMLAEACMHYNYDVLQQIVIIISRATFQRYFNLFDTDSLVII